MENTAGPAFITVVLPVRNEERFIGETLRQLQAQEYPYDRVEFLVCDGRSSDGTRASVECLAQADPRVRLLDNPGIRSSAGRNVGFRAARGEILLVIDGHVHIPGRNLLRTLDRILRESGAACAGRAQPLRATPGRPWSQAIALARASWLGHGPGSLIYAETAGFAPAVTCGAAYRREVIERIGYVDENFDACEDLDFNRRIDEAGLRCIHHPDLRVEYYARESLAALFRQMRRYGAGRVRYLRKDPARISATQLVPPGLVLAAASLPLAPWFPHATAAAAALLVAYGLLVAVASLAIGHREGWRWTARCALIFPTIHFGLGVGFLAALAHIGSATPAGSPSGAQSSRGWT